MVDYIGQFSHIEPTLHPWNKLYLIILYYFYILLNTVHYYFIKDSYVHIHVWFWYQYVVAS